MTHESTRQRLIPAKAAAAHLGMKYSTFRAVVARGVIKSVRFPGSRLMLFDVKDLETAIASHKAAHGE